MSNFLMYSERLPMQTPNTDFSVNHSSTTVSQSPRNPVLISEDDPHIMRLYETLLSRLGLHTISIPHAQQALDFIRHNPVSLIISDLHKPIMNGLDMLCHLRNNPATADVPFIMVTATPDIGTQKVFAELGGNVMLSKPFNVQTFSNAVLKLVEPQFLEESA
ncbi:MAG: response regulator [Anaerolineae bacterium]